MNTIATVSNDFLNEEMDIEEEEEELLLLLLELQCQNALFVANFLQASFIEGTRLGSFTIPRQRKTVEEVCRGLGAEEFRKFYRMSYHSFLKLSTMLEDGIKTAMGCYGLPRTYINGCICHTVRLAIALGYFSGVRLQAMVQIYNVGLTDARYSLWAVVDAVNQHNGLKIEYPTDHRVQREIAKKFENYSRAGFKGCAGCIDGLLIWISKPSRAECEKTKVDSEKYFCARKGKFGMNLQAICDVRGRFLDMSITQGGASSDYLAFIRSPIHYQLENGLLAPELHLFGDNAYVNTQYMATPYTKTKSGPKDNYNWCHSNVRIKIECSFGMLVHRWACLRMAIPMNVSIRKTTNLVMCLGKLHNFCINERDEALDSATLALQNLSVSNAYELETLGNDLIPEQMLHAGEHFDDFCEIGVQADNRTARRDILPRERMLAQVENLQIQRPALPPRT